MNDTTNFKQAERISTIIMGSTVLFLLMAIVNNSLWYSDWFINVFLLLNGLMLGTSFVVGVVRDDYQ